MTLLVLFQAPPSGATYSGSVALAGAGTLTTTGAPSPTSSAALAGSGALTGTGLPSPIGTLARTGAGTLTATGVPSPAGAATLAGAGSLTLSGVPRPTGTLALAGAGSLALSGAVPIQGSVALAGAGALASAGVPGTRGTVALAGAGALSLSGVMSFTIPGSVDLAGSGTLGLAGSPALAGSRALSGAGTATLTAGTTIKLREPTGTITTVGTAATTWTVTLPVTRVVGDVVVIGLGNDVAGAAGTPSSPGWTASASTNDVSLKASYLTRRIDGTEADTITVSWASATAGQAIAAGFRNVHIVTALDVTPVGSSEVSTTPVAAHDTSSLTTVTNGNVLVSFFSTATTATWTSADTELADTTNNGVASAMYVSAPMGVNTYTRTGTASVASTTAVSLMLALRRATPVAVSGAVDRTGSGSLTGAGSHLAVTGVSLLSGDGLLTLDPVVGLSGALDLAGDGSLNAFTPRDLTILVTLGPAAWDLTLDGATWWFSQAAPTWRLSVDTLEDPVYDTDAAIYTPAILVRGDHDLADTTFAIRIGDGDWVVPTLAEVDGNTAQLKLLVGTDAYPVTAGRQPIWVGVTDTPEDFKERAGSLKVRAGT